MKTHFYLFITVLTILIFPWEGWAQNMSGWNCDIYKYQYDMTVYLTLQQNGTSVINYKELGAFVGAECRGVAEMQTAGPLSYFYLRIRSNEESGEDISFKVYDVVNSTTLDLSVTLSFENQRQIGYPSQPEVLILPNVVTPDNIGNVNDDTEEIRLSGSWTSEQLNSLNEQLHGTDETQPHLNLNRLDLSEVILPGDEKGKTALKNILSDNEALTYVKLPASIGSSVSKEDLIENSNPNALIIVPQSVNVSGSNVIQERADGTGVATSIFLEDKRPFQTPCTIDVAENVSYIREFINSSDFDNPSGLDAIMVPFAVISWSLMPPKINGYNLRSEKKEQSLIFYELIDDSFYEVTELKANTPYLVKCLEPGIYEFNSEKSSTLSITQNEYVVHGSSFDLVGTFLPISSENMLILNDEGNKFIKGNNVDPFRIYIRPVSASVPDEIIIKINVPVTGVTFSDLTLSLEKGESRQLKATIMPNNATNRNLSWKSKDQTVVLIDDKGGIIALAEGTTVITVTTEDGNYSASCTVTVTNTQSKPDPTPNPEPDPSPDPDPDPNPPTGIELKENKPVVQLFPTFITDGFNVTGLRGVGQMDLFNISGSKLHSININNSDTFFSMEKWGRGYYIVVVKQRDVVYTFKIYKK